MVNTLLWTLFFLYQAALGFSSSSAMAGGIDTVREKVIRYQALADQFDTIATKLSENPQLVRKYHHIDAKPQYCSVLADLLYLGPEATADAVRTAPETSSTDPEEFILYALSLRSYVSTALVLLQEDDFSWQYKWNLNCYAVYASQTFFRIKDSVPFSVTVSADKSVLRVVGDVKPGLYDAIAKRLAIHRSIKTVELASLGGSGPDGMKIGRLLRKKRITTVVSSNCNSSCALMFLGGSRRIVPAPYWELGFHRASEQGVAVWDGDEFYQELRVYFDEMIGDGDELLRRSLLQDDLDFYRPSQKDLCLLNIATVVESVCKSDTGGKRSAVKD